MTESICGISPKCNRSLDKMILLYHSLGTAQTLVWPTYTIAFLCPILATPIALEFYMLRILISDPLLLFRLICFSFRNELIESAPKWTDRNKNGNKIS